MTELHAPTALSWGSIEIVNHLHLVKHRGEVLLYPYGTNTLATTWVLLAPGESQVRINDAALESGIRILTDRDAIRVPGRSTIYFSTERLARIEAFPDAEHVYCPRCKLMICEGGSAVCCPQCGVWHH